MLGHTYRYQVYNGTGVGCTVTLTERPWKFDSSGARVDASESARISAVSIATVSYDESSTIDNSSVLNLGADVVITLTPASSATGSLLVYLQRSTDGGTTWPSDGKGQPLAGHYFSASSTAVTLQATV